MTVERGARGSAYAVGNEIFGTRCARLSRGRPQTDGGPEGIQVGRDALIESVESVAFLLGERRVGGDGSEQAGGQRRMDALEELGKQDADPVALGSQAIAACVLDFLDEPFGPGAR